MRKAQGWYEYARVTVRGVQPIVAGYRPGIGCFQAARGYRERTNPAGTGTHS